MPQRYTFRKRERLCSHKLIESLYRSTHHWVCYPWAVYWEEVESEEPVQVLITVSKRRFHHAVDRNRVKRVTRECYRLKKEMLRERVLQSSKHLAVSISYIDNKLPVWDEVLPKMERLVGRIAEEQSKTEQQC